MCLYSTVFFADMVSFTNLPIEANKNGLPIKLCGTQFTKWALINPTYQPKMTALHEKHLSKDQIKKIHC